MGNVMLIFKYNILSDDKTNTTPFKDNMKSDDKTNTTPFTGKKMWKMGNVMLIFKYNILSDDKTNTTPWGKRFNSEEHYLSHQYKSGQKPNQRIVNAAKLLGVGFDRDEQQPSASMVFSERVAWDVVDWKQQRAWLGSWLHLSPFTWFASIPRVFRPHQFLSRITHIFLFAVFKQKITKIDFIA